MRALKTCCLCLLLACFFLLPAGAANHVKTIELQSVIQKNGNLEVTHLWSGSFTEGTELYLPLHLLEDVSVSEFWVQDEAGLFRVLDNWDVRASRAEKNRRCGLLSTETGVELCFGLGNYGARQFKLGYTLDKAIAAYPEADAVNARFLDQEMNTTPTDVTLRVRMADGTPLNEENCAIWPLGFAGEARFEGGEIVASTSEPMGPANHFSLLFGLQKGLIEPSREESGSFDAMRDRALAGRDYAQKQDAPSAGSIFLIIGCSLGSVGLVLLLFLLYRKRKGTGLPKRAGEASRKPDGYFREIPNGGNQQASCVLGSYFELCDESALFTASLLRLLDLGCLETVDVPAEGSKEKHSYKLQLLHEPSGQADELAEYLYSTLSIAAAGRAYLDEKHLAYYAIEHDELFRGFLEKSRERGRLYLARHDLYEDTLRLGQPDQLEGSGRQQLRELAGFRQYLYDYNRLAERAQEEPGNWRELLAYALFFNTVDRLLTDLKKLYPQMQPQLARYEPTLHAARTFGKLLHHGVKTGEVARTGGARSKKPKATE